MLPAIVVGVLDLHGNITSRETQSLLFRQNASEHVKDPPMRVLLQAPYWPSPLQRPRHQRISEQLPYPHGSAGWLVGEFLHTPAAADSFLKTVSKLYTWARQELEFDASNPAEKVTRVNTNSPGFDIWTTEDVRRYLKRHPEGTAPRLAMVLELCTATRRGDLVALGKQNVETTDGVDWIRWRKEKPPHIEVEIPLLDILADELRRHAPDGERWPVRQTFIATLTGRPRNSAAFGNTFAKWCEEAGVGKRLHGIRKGLASILPEFGVSEYGIDVLLGHELGSGSSRVYTRGARRREIAREVNEQWAKVKW